MPEPVAVLWTFQLDAPARGAPVVAGDTVLAVSATNSLFAVNISDGSKIWTFDGIPEETGLLGSGSPAVSGQHSAFPPVRRVNWLRLISRMAKCVGQIPLFRDLADMPFLEFPQLQADLLCQTVWSMRPV